MTIWDEIDTIYNQAGENGEGACTFSVPGTFSGYRGHFPGNPILPGIVQLSFIRRLAERRLGRALRLAGVRRIKYLRTITPDMPVTLTLTLEPGEAENTWAANASFLNDIGKSVSAAKLIFAPKESAI
jgi:3-hydroxymyristoyl/3-hydroxydecanoyl-(acyl carrier protein) dehydratase